MMMKIDETESNETRLRGILSGIWKVPSSSIAAISSL